MSACSPSSSRACPARSCAPCWISSSKSWVPVWWCSGVADADSGKVSLIAGVTNDLTGRLKAGDLVKHVAAQVGGKGGGRADMAQAGGSDPEALPEALASVPAWVEEQLG